MKQLKIEVTRASNGYARKEGRLTKQSERFVRMMEKEGCEVETHSKSGDMIATLKGKPMGYYFGEHDVGYVFESVKDFATFLKKAEAGEFEASTRSPSKSDTSDATPTRGKKAATGSDLAGKRRARRTPEDGTKPVRGKKAVASSSASESAEPDLDLDDYVDENASDSANALELLKLLKKEMKRVGVMSENVNGLVDVVTDYVKAAVKAEGKRK